MKKIIIINIIVFFFLLIIIELIFGNWLKKNNFGFLDRELRNISIPISVEYDGTKYNYNFKRNELGFIGDNIAAKDIKILFLGGSTGEEMFIPPENTIVSMLNYRLKKDKINYEIINASKGGKTTRGYVNDFLKWFDKIEDLKPEIVIFYLGLNDSFLDYPEYFDDLERKDILKKTEDYIKNNSLIYSFKKRLELKYFNPKRQYYNIEKKDLYKNYSYINYETAKKKYGGILNFKKNKIIIDNFSKNLQNLKTIIDNKRFTPIFITQIKYNGISDYDLFLVNEYLKDFCRKNKYKIIKLDEKIKNMNTELFYDELHTKIKGSLFLSNIIYSDLKEILLKIEK